LSIAPVKEKLFEGHVKINKKINNLEHHQDSLYSSQMLGIEVLLKNYPPIASLAKK
jgi:hypothetical protein